MNMKKFLAAGLSAVMLLTMAACGSDEAASSSAASSSAAASAPAFEFEGTGATVITINGKAYTDAEYAAFLNNARVEWSTYLSQFGMTEEDYIEIYGAETFTQDLTDRAMNYMVLNDVLVSKMDEYGLELTEEDTAMSALYEAMGMDASYGTLQAMLTKVSDYCVGEGGTMRPSEDELMDFFMSSYLRCKHVLIKTVDDSYNPLENQDELAATAQDIAVRAQSGEDFDALIKEYNEDPGMESNKDGYVFTEGTMVDEFYQGTLALEEGGVSDPVESSYGWHIIQRLPLREEDFASVEDEVLEKLADFDSVLQGWANESEVIFNEAEAAAVAAEVLPA